MLVMTMNYTYFLLGRGALVLDWKEKLEELSRYIHSPD